VVLAEWYEVQTWFNVRIKREEDVYGFLLGNLSRELRGRCSGRALRGISFFHPRDLMKVSKYFQLELPPVNKRPFQKDPEGAVNLFSKLLTLAI
jgi:hypothetical protein